MLQSNASWNDDLTAHFLSYCLLWSLRWSCIHHNFPLEWKSWEQNQLLKELSTKTWNFFRYSQTCIVSWDSDPDAWLTPSKNEPTVSPLFFLLHLGPCSCSCYWWGADPNKHLLHSCQSGMVAGSRAYVLEPLFQSPEPSSPPAAAVSPQKPGGSAVFLQQPDWRYLGKKCKGSESRCEK